MPLHNSFKHYQIIDITAVSLIGAVNTLQNLIAKFIWPYLLARPVTATVLKVFSYVLKSVNIS